MYNYSYRKLMPSSTLFFRTAQFNHDNYHKHKIKTMFMCGSTRAEVLDLIDETLQHPNHQYEQPDGASVSIKSFPRVVGEFFFFDTNGNLKSKPLNTVKVVTVNRNGSDIEIRTAFPLLRRT